MGKYVEETKKILALKYMLLEDAIGTLTDDNKRSEMCDS